MSISSRIGRDEKNIKGKEKERKEVVMELDPLSGNNIGRGAQQQVLRRLYADPAATHCDFRLRRMHCITADQPVHNYYRCCWKLQSLLRLRSLE